MTARATLPRRDLRHPDGRAFHVYGHQVDWDLTAAAGTPFDPSELHRRLDRLTDSWVLVSPAPHRSAGEHGIYPPGGRGPRPGTVPADGLWCGADQPVGHVMVAELTASASTQNCSPGYP